MKRIVSMALTLVMVMTMFCGILSIGSSALSPEGLAGTLTVVTGPVQEDGTFDVAVYISDTSDYGWTALGIKMYWDETKIAPVVQQLEKVQGKGDMADYYFDHTYFYLLSKEFGFNNFTKCELETNGKSGTRQVIYKAGATENSSGITFASVGFATAGLRFSKEFLEEEDYLEDFAYDEQYGIPLATATFCVLPGATGTTDIEVKYDVASLASDDSDNPKSLTEQFDKVVNGKATVNLGGASKLTVETKGASIRTKAPTGLRFTTTISDVNDPEWAAIAEQGSNKFGTAIYLGGDTTGKAVHVPASVSYLAEEGTFNAVVSMPTAAGKQQFTAVPYKVVDGAYVEFDSTPKTMSMAEIAQAALDDDTVSTPAAVKELLQKYIDCEA